MCGTTPACNSSIQKIEARESQTQDQPGPPWELQANKDHIVKLYLRKVLLKIYIKQSLKPEEAFRGGKDSVTVETWGLKG